MVPDLTLVFSVLLLLGVLISERASRTVLSSAVEVCQGSGQCDSLFFGIGSGG